MANKHNFQHMKQDAGEYEYDINIPSAKGVEMVQSMTSQ